MPTWTFKIGEAFPAADAVARFVTVLAMMSNDWHRSMRAMNDSLEDDADGQGTRLMLFRQQVAYHHEATKFLTKTRREYPDVDRFLDGLDADARRQYDTVIAIDSELQTWQANNRNVTFHYPTMVRARYEHGAEEVANALGEAAELEGTITADDGSYPRFGFADEVAVNLVNLTDRDLVSKLSTARIALTELVYAGVFVVIIVLAIKGTISIVAAILLAFVGTPIVGTLAYWLALLIGLPLLGIAKLLDGEAVSEYLDNQPVEDY